METKLRNVLAVTSWGGACGIANYAEMLQDGLYAGAPGRVQLHMDAAALDPAVALARLAGPPRVFDLVWLNYHAGLHSRWTDTTIGVIRNLGYPVVVTYHDTYDGTDSPNTAQCKRILAAATLGIVHEPIDPADVPGEHIHYLRQGVPASRWRVEIDRGYNGLLKFPAQPILGTAGFDFPWKNYTRLAELTAELGWAFMVVSNNLTQERQDELRSKNPYLLAYPGFKSTHEIVSLLSACDATAWMYECHNSGTSGAIRLGIAAGKPLFVLKSCRQFRDLREPTPWGPMTPFTWVTGWSNLADQMINSWPMAYDAGCVWVATRDSWTNQARRYADLFDQAVGRAASPTP